MAARSALEIIKKIGLSFRRNWGLKLASLFFALILWNYVIVAENPQRTVTYTGVRVTFDNSSITQLHNSGFTVKGALPEKTITVTVDIKRNEASLLNRDQIQAVASLSGITSDGTKDVHIQVRSPRGTVKSPLQSMISVEIERLLTRQVPVVPKTEGTLPENYWHDEPTITPGMLQISGASSVVSRVDHAEVTVPLGGLTGKLSAARDFALFDKDGNALSMDGLDITPPGTSCIVNLDVYPTKTVRIDASGSFSGNPAKGYEVGSIVTVPAEMLIAGPAETLSTISVLTPEPIEVDGKDSDVSGYRKLRLPQGVHTVGDNTVLVHAFIAKRITTVSIENVPITVRNLGAGLKASLGQPRANVTVACPELTASKVRSGSIRLFVDATGLDARSYTLTILSEYDQELGITDVAVDPETVLLTITAAAP